MTETGKMLSKKKLHCETLAFQGTGGVSAENRSHGFQPAFLDKETGVAHLSRFSDGQLAPVHILDGLPDGLVTSRSAGGQVLAVKASVVAGFFAEGRFYTREEVACAVAVECNGRASRRAA